MKAEIKAEQRIYDCAVIGGGAAGMLCAIELKNKGLCVLIVEHTNRIGTKLLQTGNGKCNFTNMIMNETKYQNDQKSFVMSVIGRMNQKDTIAFFESIGVYSRERNGYVYPHSDTAASLQNALRMKIEQEKIKISTEFKIKTICQKDNLYEIIGENYTYYARTVVLATGSKAAPKTGSDGSGYHIAEQLGHQIIKPLPALVQLISSCSECRVMTGVRSLGKVSLYVDGELVAAETGEVQYTDYGISGIPVFQISRYAVKAVDEGKNVSAIINMLPDYTDSMVEAICRKGMKNYGYKNVEQFFEGMLHKKLVSASAKKSGINTGIPADRLGLECILKCARELMHYEFRITGYKDFEYAQICQGGVSLTEVDEYSMMSKIKSGLFFAGEILDVDGKCGGYNLQWAWSSGYVAAHGAAEFLKNCK